MEFNYTAMVLDHFMNPRNVGEIENADAIGEAGSAECGDMMRIYLKIDNDIVTDVKFKTFGCAAAIASSSMATEMIKGKTIDEVKKIYLEGSIKARKVAFETLKRIRKSVGVEYFC